jgi:hypothetical protein
MQSGEDSKVATTDKNISGLRGEAGAADPAPAGVAALQATTSPGAAAFISERGGSLYVWARTFQCCGGVPVRIVYSSTEAPRGLTEFRQFDAGGYQVMLHPSIGRAPSQMAVRLRGRWRPRITVYWDGMPI